MSRLGGLLSGVNRISGVRGSMIVAADDGLVVEADLMVGVPGPAVAALAASLFGRARRSVAASDLGSLAFLQLEAADGLVFAAAPAAGSDLLLVVVADPNVNVGLVRIEAGRAAGEMG